MNLTKKEVQKFALDRGYEARYSGKLRRHFFTRLIKIDIHKLINNKQS